MITGPSSSIIQAAAYEFITKTMRNSGFFGFPACTDDKSSAFFTLPHFRLLVNKEKRRFAALPADASRSGKALRELNIRAPVGGSSPSKRTLPPWAKPQRFARAEELPDAADKPRLFCPQDLKRRKFPAIMDLQSFADSADLNLNSKEELT